jgi:hypothetical protein
MPSWVRTYSVARTVSPDVRAVLDTSTTISVTVQVAMGDSQSTR